MQVINLKNTRYKNTHKPSKKKKFWVFGLLAVVILMSLIVFVFLLKGQKVSNESQKQEVQNNQVANVFPEEAKKGILKEFTGDQFKHLYNSFAYPNTALISDHAPITGNDLADQRIRQLATSRGYLIRGAPVTDNFQNFDGELLQQKAAEAWQELLSAAQKDGLQFGLTAGYRSADDQRQIFLDRLKAQNVNIVAIPSGMHDAQITQVLKTTAVPGYSRHHSGYTVDIACKNMPAAAFKNTPCFTWLSADNYKNSKENGWIPSYPDGAQNQGPDPEEWEYVWVGKDALLD